VSFRNRVLAAATVTVALAIAAVCAVAYGETRASVLDSVDQSLAHSAHANSGASEHENFVAGTSFQLVLATGQSYPPSHFDLPSEVLVVARQHESHAFITTSAGNSTFRILAVALPIGSEISCPQGECVTTRDAAQVFTVDITGQVAELKHLKARLALIAAIAVLAAAILAFFTSRSAVRPLTRVTDDIEGIAQSGDVTYRLIESGRDELGRLRRTFNTLLQSVDESQQLQRQLVLDASHELRTPLTSLRTNAQLLPYLERMSRDEILQLSADMTAQVNELANLITDLGELARGERSEGETDDIALEDLVGELVTTARTHARTKRITIDLHVEPAQCRARADRLSRAISNLLSNAIKFTPEDGRIVVSLSAHQLTIEDSGPGIPEDERSRVFDRFWRSPSARALPGSGLGLAIVQQVTHEIGGTMSVGSSDALGGASFTLFFPQPGGSR
jgi:two-component system sensor histidine kinase MprB